MSAQPISYFSTADYLDFERASPERHEYYFGEIFNMSGASRKHNRIAQNLGSELYQRLKGSKCNPYQSDLRVRIPNTPAYTYPDIVVVCGTEDFEDDIFDTLLNPTIIVEVLSEGTAAYDRGKKFELYQTIPSLREYLLISQEATKVEQFIRQAENEWTYKVYNQITESVHFPTLKADVPMEDIYYDIQF